MSVTLKVVFLLTLAVGLSLGAIERGIAQINPAFPGKCWIQDRNEAFSPGSSWQLKGACGKGSCDESNGELHFIIETCGVIAVPPSCKIVEDKSKPHPDCCPEMKCN